LAKQWHKLAKEAVFEDQSAKPEERHAADPDGLHCGFQRRTDLRFAIEGHEDEDQVQRQADPAACEEGHPEQASHCSIASNALSYLTGANPVAPKDRGNLKRMKDAWLRWGRNNLPVW